MLILRDLFTISCVVAGTMAVSMGMSSGVAAADDLDMATWSKTFQFLGASAGQYDACTHRDQTPSFADLSVRMANGRNDDTSVILEDAARIAYFAALASPCDPSQVESARADMNQWARTIRKATAGQ